MTSELYVLEVIKIIEGYNNKEIRTYWLYESQI
jgi:hypothetical protein